jgi:hypothetical protein
MVTKFKEKQLIPPILILFTHSVALLFATFLLQHHFP